MNISEVPSGLTLKEVGQIFRNRSLVKQLVKAGKLRPVVKGGRGRLALFDAKDVSAVWDELKQGQ